VSANVNSNFPFSGQLSYSWTNDCGDGTVVTPADTTNASQINLAFSKPGLGQTVLCSVSVTVHNNTCQEAFSSTKLGIADECVQDASCAAQIEVPPCVLDCKGLINGPAKLDQCGVCDGDGTSCLGCNSTDITNSLFALDGLGLAQKALVRKASALFVKAGGSKAKAAKYNNTADQLYTKNWEGTWSLPHIAVQCTNTDFCVQADNSGVIADYRSNSDALKALADAIAQSVIKLAKKSAKLKSSAKTILKQSSILGNQSLAETQSVPVTTSACTTVK
jgi:hypothetical protein